MNLMLPMVSELEARDQRQLIVDRMALATRMSLQATLPVALAIAFFSSDIVDLWLGSGAPNVTGAIMAVLALQTLMICGVPSQKVLIGIGRARAVGLINTAEGILNLTISIILVSAYGAIGAAIGTLISSYLIGPANFPLACRATGYPLGRFFGRTLVARDRLLAAQRDRDALGLAGLLARPRAAAARRLLGSGHCAAGRAAPAWTPSRPLRGPLRAPAGPARCGDLAAGRAGPGLARGCGCHRV